MTTKKYQNFEHVFCKGFKNIENGAVVSREALEKAHDYLMGRMDALYRRMKGLHYGKPRRNALEAEYEAIDAIDEEIVRVLLFGYCDEWEAVDSLEAEEEMHACEDIDISWLRDTPAYAKLYGYASRYCELVEGGDWSLTDDEREDVTNKVDALMTGVAEAIACYHDLNPDLIIEFAIDSWYEEHDHDED